MADPLFTWTDSDGDELRIARDYAVIHVSTIDRDGIGVTVRVPHHVVPTLAKEALAAAGDTGHIVVSSEDSARAIRIRESVAAESMRDRAEGVARRVNVGGGVAALIRALPLLPSDGEEVAHSGGSLAGCETPNEQPADSDTARQLAEIRERVDQDIQSDRVLGQEKLDRFRLLDMIDDLQEQPAEVHVATPEGITPCGQGHHDVTTAALIAEVTCVECLRAIAIERGREVTEVWHKFQTALGADPGTPWPALLEQVEELRARTEVAPDAARPATPADLPHIIRQMDEWNRAVAAAVDLQHNPLADRVTQLERCQSRIERRLNLLEIAQGRVDRLHDRVDALELAARERNQSGGAEHATVASGGYAEPDAYERAMANNPENRSVSACGSGDAHGPHPWNGLHGEDLHCPGDDNP